MVVDKKNAGYPFQKIMPGDLMRKKLRMVLEQNPDKNPFQAVAKAAGVRTSVVRRAFNNQPMARGHWRAVAIVLGVPY